MSRAVLVPIGPGPGGRPRVVGRPAPVDGGGAANDVVAEAVLAGVTHLAAFPAVNGLDQPADGAAKDDPPPLDGWPAEANFGELAIEARSRLTSEAALSCGPGSVVVLAVPALVEVGGFDPDQPGLGLLDLVDRLTGSGWATLGINRRSMPFVPALTAGLGTADRVASEGRWLRTRATDRAGRRRLERYQRLVLDSIAELRAGTTSDPGSAPSAAPASGTGAGSLDPEVLDRMEADAQRRWQGLRPDEAQQGVGRRADWRHLLPPRPGDRPRRLVVLSGLGPIDEWSWLVDDGWAGRLVDRLPMEPTADVIVLGPASPAELDRQLDSAVASLAPGGVLCLLMTGGRSPGVVGRHRLLVRRLSGLGLASVRRHLALPDAGGVKRFVPIDHPGGPAWFAGPEPALGVAALPAARRRLREGAGRMAAVTPELLGDVAIVATADPQEAWPEAVVLTSGFDEGSRTVLLPFDRLDATRPSAVVKVSARPSYRANGDREHRLLQVIAPRVEPAGLVPEPLELAERDGLPAVVEGYAGRWTAADILHEQTTLADRAALLDALLASVTALNRTGLGTERWRAESFEANVGRWFDEVDRIEGPSASRAALRAALVDRSDRLVGTDIPVGLRHFDLGPWNLVLADAETGNDGRRGPGGSGSGPRSLVTVVDWELAPPREVAFGPIGTDQLYLCKYWLHVALGCGSVEEEQSAFPFLAESAAVDASAAGDPTAGGDARVVAKAAMATVAGDIGLPLGFLPILEAGVWAEAACYTARRRRARGGDGGSPARYLDTMARHRVRLLAAWD